MFSNKSSNIANSGFERVQHTQSSTNTMSLSGTLNKTLILTLLVLIGGIISWNQVIPMEFFFPVFISSLVIGLVIAITLAFKPLLANILAPIYAFIQGIFLGFASLLFETMYPGIVVQAILLTIVVALVMNLLYRNKIIKVTGKFMAVIMVATLAIFLTYMVSLLMSLFLGSGIPLIHQSGPVGIGFSLFVVTIASLNLLLDFHFIDTQVKNHMPKKMEWYGAFALIVTLIWIYLEILKLLAKLRNKN